MELQERILEKLDVGYSYRLAKRMEEFRSNEALGYRPAGSLAEFQTGEMLKAEMERIGLSQVEKDPVTVDGWEFKRAVLSYLDQDGEKRSIQLGAYQTTLVTDGPREYILAYVGKGTEADYQGRDVTGQLVLADINQRDEWWINYPVYQAHLKGAAALIAVQSGGYGEIDDDALNAQDIAGPEDAPAFSISRREAASLKRLMEARGGQIQVTLDADTRVMRDCTTYNIVGRIPGRHPHRMVMLSAHYDSYFSGFQDDNTAVAMMLGIAKALLDSGFQPENTILFCAMAAEEWGVIDSNFDWSAGAYEQVFTAHPEWAGQVIADFNFELPALPHGTRARIRSCYEYTRFLKDCLAKMPPLTHAYPDETAVTAPIETWSDDFSIAIAGIPSMVNDFTGGSFMETHYHSQFDNDSFYDEQVYLLHHQLFALLVAALDQTAVVPLDFTPVIQRLEQGLSKAVQAKLLKQEQAAPSLALLRKARETAAQEYAQLERLNCRFASLLKEGQRQEAETLFASCRGLEQQILTRFKAAQDRLVRIDWYGNVFYPLEILSQNLALLQQAEDYLRERRLSHALRCLYQVDNNAYAFMFQEAVYRHFTDYVLNQPPKRLKWGYGRLMPHQDLYQLVQTLLEERRSLHPHFHRQLEQLTGIRKDQERLLEESAAELPGLITDLFLRETARSNRETK